MTAHRRLEAVCPLHRVELPVPGRRQPVPRAWPRASAGAASCSRLAMVAGAALAISLVTYFAVPGGFIFFGILHQIALASLLGLAFLRLPALVTLVAAARVIAAPLLLRSAFFDHPWLVVARPVADRSALQRLCAACSHGSAPCLSASRAAKLAAHPACSSGSPGSTPPASVGRCSFAGRHSLAFYLIHQPRADRLRLAVRAGLPRRDGNARGAVPAILRGAVRGLPRRRVLHALLCVHARRRSKRERIGSTRSFADEQTAAERAQLQSLAGDLHRARPTAIMSEGGQP